MQVAVLHYCSNTLLHHAVMSGYHMHPFVNMQHSNLCIYTINLIVFIYKVYLIPCNRLHYICLIIAYRYIISLVSVL